MSEVALVTGASSGIGAELAKQFSARGYEVILVARRTERLEQLASELPGPAYVVPCDLVNEAASLADKVAGLGLQVDVLVNNAGFGTHGHFAEIDLQREAEEVRLNCEAVVTLTHASSRACSSESRRRDHRGVDRRHAADPVRGDLQRDEGVRPHFQRCPQRRAAGHRRACHVRQPGPVPTEWQQVAGDEADWVPPVPGKISAEQVASESMRAFERGRRTIIPGFVMRWFVRINKPAPLGIKMRVLERMYRPER